MTPIAIVDGFIPSEDWRTVTLGCSACGYCERWMNIDGPQNDRRLGMLTKRAKETRLRIEADIRQVLRDKGCQHV